MKFENFEITKREILVSIIIVLLLVTLGIFISNGIENSIEEDNEKYYKSLKIDNDEETFKYAIDTNVGYVLSSGKVKAVNGVEIDDISGKYFYIKKVREEYTRHTREVEHTRTIGNTTETYYTTEVYYTWDYAGQEEFHVKQFEYLGVTFEYGTIDFYNSSYKETIKINSDTRYKYYVIPLKFDGCLFTKIQDNTITENEFYYNNTIENIINNKQNEARNTKILFWFLWIFLIILIVGLFIYAENKYLEDDM